MFVINLFKMYNKIYKKFRRNNDNVSSPLHVDGHENVKCLTLNKYDARERLRKTNSG